MSTSCIDKYPIQLKGKSYAQNAKKGAQSCNAQNNDFDGQLDISSVWVKSLRIPKMI